MTPMTPTNLIAPVRTGGGGREAQRKKWGTVGVIGVVEVGGNGRKYDDIA